MLKSRYDEFQEVLVQFVRNHTSSSWSRIKSAAAHHRGVTRQRAINKIKSAPSISIAARKPEMAVFILQIYGQRSHLGRQLYMWCMGRSAAGQQRMLPEYVIIVRGSGNNLMEKSSPDLQVEETHTKTD